jgi:hypothetical protein
MAEVPRPEGRGAGGRAGLALLPDVSECVEHDCPHERMAFREAPVERCDAAAMLIAIMASPVGRLRQMPAEPEVPPTLRTRQRCLGTGDCGQLTPSACQRCLRPARSSTPAGLPCRVADEVRVAEQLAAHVTARYPGWTPGASPSRSAIVTSRSVSVARCSWVRPRRRSCSCWRAIRLSSPIMISPAGVR